MAYDFLGTFNKSQFTRFAEFVRSQISMIPLRMTHNIFEINRSGTISFAFDAAGNPTSFSGSTLNEPINRATYIGKLISAYEVLGGDIQYDLQVRSMKQAVYLVPASETAPPQLMSNGEVMGQKGLADAVSAQLMKAARAAFLAPLHYKREYLERKVRRTVDYVDQLTAENTLMGEATTSPEDLRSVEAIFQAIGELFTDQTYRAIYDDKGTDVYGKLTYAPFAPYSTADAKVLPTETAGYVRDADGARVPGLTTPE